MPKFLKTIDDADEVDEKYCWQARKNLEYISNWLFEPDYSAEIMTTVKEKAQEAERLIRGLRKYLDKVCTSRLCYDGVSIEMDVPATNKYFKNLKEWPESPF